MDRQLPEEDFITKKSISITAAMARITRITQEMPPCGAGAVFFFGLAGRNFAILAMVALGGEYSMETGEARQRNAAKNRSDGICLTQPTDMGSMRFDTRKAGPSSESSHWAFTC